MKGRIFVVIILVAGAAVAGRVANRSAEPRMSVASTAEREETRQTFKLDAGARVEVRSINGRVEVKTAETDTAEVHIVRTASSPEELEESRVFVEGEPSSLVVRGERGGGGGPWRWLSGHGGGARQEVTLVLPRRVELSASHLNGALSVGEVEGSVEVSHVNGRVEVAQTGGRPDISHVNGGVRIGVSRLGADGMDVSHVNGNIEIRLAQAVDADVEVRKHHGGLTLRVPNVTQHERLNRSNARLRFGAGGAPVQISHVNGGVRFETEGGAGVATTVNSFDAAGPHALPPLPPVPPAP